MPDDGKKGKGGGFLKEEFIGIPGWIWLVGAAVIVGGYLYLRHQSNASSSGQQQSGQQGKAPAASVTLIPFQTMTKSWMTDHQKSPHKSKVKNTNAPGNPSGPVVS